MAGKTNPPLVPDTIPDNLLPPTPPTPTDSCDQCGHSSDGTGVSQAFIKATKAGLSLLFCGHHFRRHEVALRVGGWSITDSRDTINSKPTG